MNFKLINSPPVEKEDIQPSRLVNIVKGFNSELLNLPLTNVDSISAKNFTNINVNELYEKITDGQCDTYLSEQPVTPLHYVTNKITDPNTFNYRCDVISVVHNLVAMVDRNCNLVYARKEGETIREMTYIIVASQDGRYKLVDFIKNNTISDKVVDYISTNGFTGNCIIDLDTMSGIYKTPTEDGDRYDVIDVLYIRNPKSIRNEIIDDSVLL